jgi:hypothetical protein
MADVIEPRAESLRDKIRPPAFTRPESEPRADQTEARALRDRLWALHSAAPAAAYGPPWSRIAADLAARLLSSLAAKPVDAASSAEDARVIAKLSRDPFISRILVEIRGLASAADLAPAALEAPGVALEYDDA